MNDGSVMIALVKIVVVVVLVVNATTRTLIPGNNKRSNSSTDRDIVVITRRRNISGVSSWFALKIVSVAVITTTVAATLSLL